MNAALHIESLEKVFQGARGLVRALDGVTMQVGSGQWVVVRGPSGCGKTTLLLAVAGLLRPTRGTVRVDGENLYELTTEKRAKARAARIGIVFQQFHLIPYLTARDNILASTLALRTDGAEARAEELAGRLGLRDRMHHVPANLSTGERQRVALARALLNRPKLVLADEPTGNLDPENSRIVLEELAAYAREGGSVLMATHDPEVERFAQLVFKMQSGKWVN